jgi:hypothetical protein
MSPPQAIGGTLLLLVSAPFLWVAIYLCVIKPLAKELLSANIPIEDKIKQLQTLFVPALGFPKYPMGTETLRFRDGRTAGGVLFAYDVFLSYNTKDSPRVRRLAKRLRAGGLRVWFDEWVIKAGDTIYITIERGLDSSRTLVLCMSPAAFESNWVQMERTAVLFLDPANQDRRFIPLLLADCNIPATLRQYRYIDYRDEGEPAFQELMKVCRVETEENEQ